MISGGFPGRLLKFFFYLRNLSLWLAAFSFAFEELFLPLTLLFAMLMVIVYSQPNFNFYRFDLKCILIVLFGMCSLVLFGLS